jgi:hypothetical protein
MDRTEHGQLEVHGLLHSCNHLTSKMCPDIRDKGGKMHRPDEGEFRLSTRSETIQNQDYEGGTS